MSYQNEKDRAGGMVEIAILCAFKSFKNSHSWECVASKNAAFNLANEQVTPSCNHVDSLFRMTLGMEEDILTPEYAIGADALGGIALGFGF